MMPTPIIAETMPATRSRLSGMSMATAMARLVPSGNAAKTMPSIAKNRPIAARKSDMDTQPAVGVYFDPGGLDAIEVWGAIKAWGLGRTRASGGILPDGSEK